MTATRCRDVFLNAASTHSSDNITDRRKETERESVSPFFQVATVQIGGGRKGAYYTRRVSKSKGTFFLCSRYRFQIQLTRLYVLFARSLILLAALRVYADAAPGTIEDLSVVNFFLRGILSCFLRLNFFSSTHRF